MTRKELKKASIDKTWLVYDNALLVQVDVGIERALGFYIVGDDIWIEPEDLRMATAKDLMELSE